MRKYDFISALAQETATEVVKNRDEWMKYLTTAARLYKYPFNEQMLIYAQRPDATACALLETWNEKMNCWVNRGAKGIALIDTDSERPRLKYVFDVSDVHKARRIGRDPYLWELKEEHKAPVLAQLEKTYGATDVNMPFEERIMEIADRIAQDYYEELLPELNYVKEGSFLDDLDELNLGIRLRETLACIADNAYVIGKFGRAMKYSMMKTFAFKYKTKVPKIKKKYVKNGDFTVSYETKQGLKTSVFYNQGYGKRDSSVAGQVELLPQYKRYDRPNSLARKLNVNATI